jgi:hypothetical protein
MIATIVSLVVFLPLMMVALAHLFWALGATWPIRDELLLVQTVIGTPAATHMPNKLIILLGAIGLFLSGIIAMGLAGHDDGGITRTVLGAVLAVVFLARGVAGYTPGWRASHPVEPFATLDRRNYSPLCLWLGTGFLILVVLRLI